MKLKEPEENNNRLLQIREALLIGKTELARRAGVSPRTIDRIEEGFFVAVQKMQSAFYNPGKPDFIRVQKA